MKNELISELKDEVKSVISEAVATAIAPLQLVVSDQNLKIEKLSANNKQIKKLMDEKCDVVNAKYENFRNIANATAKYMNDNKRITGEHTTLVH